MGGAMVAISGFATGRSFTKRICERAGHAAPVFRPARWRQACCGEDGAEDHGGGHGAAPAPARRREGQLERKAVDFAATRR